MIVSDSPQYLIDSILLNEGSFYTCIILSIDIEFTDLSSSVTAIYPISSSSSLNYDTLLLVIQEWKKYSIYIYIINSPLLVFAFLQEIFYPILSSSIHQTFSLDDEKNDKSIQLSKNLNFLFEEYKLKLSSRKGFFFHYLYLYNRYWWT